MYNEPVAAGILVALDIGPIVHTHEPPQLFLLKWARKMDDEMDYLRIANWDNLQHYKDRNPPWIKLHNSLLDNYEFISLPDSTKAHFLAITMLASRTENKIPADAAFISARIGANTKVDIDSLVNSGFIEIIKGIQEDTDASNPLQNTEQSAIPEQSRAEQSRDRAEQIDVIFNHWVSVMNKPRATLTKNRRTKILARLKEGYLVNDIKGAIDGCAGSEYHMGKNDTGTVYDDLELICRNGSKLENFRDTAGKVIQQDINARNFQATRDFANE